MSTQPTTAAPVVRMDQPASVSPSPESNGLTGTSAESVPNGSPNLTSSRLPVETAAGAFPGNGQHKPSQLSKGQGRKKRIRYLLYGGGVALLALGILVVVAAVSGAAWLPIPGLGKSRTDLILHTVKYEKLQLTIVERGALEAADNRDITCRVKARSQGNSVASTIRWVIDDGTLVSQGQVLLELDDSGLQDQLKTQKINRDKARNDWLQAKLNLEIQLIENDYLKQQAKTAVALKEMELKKYVQGDYEQTKKDIQGRRELALSDYKNWLERIAWSERMNKSGLVTASQVQAERSRLNSAEIAMKKVEEEMRVLEDPSFGAKAKMITELTGMVNDARLLLKKAETQAEANKDKATQALKTAESVYQLEQSKCDDIEEEIRKCVIRAPQDGMVVYFMSEQSRYGSGSSQSIVAQGEPVREGQKLMRLPNLKHMLVNTRVHEAMVSRVKGEDWKKTGYCDSICAGLLTAPDLWTRLGSGAFVHGQHDLSQVTNGGQQDWVPFRDYYRDKDRKQSYGGQKALIRVDAYPDRMLTGHVRTVATVNSQSDFYSSDVKVYQTMVSIDEEVKDLKPGMSAEVTIFTDDQVQRALTVPLQAILGSAEMGKTRKVYVMTDNGPEERDVEVGISNDKMAQIKSGVAEGEQVIVNPRVLLSEKDKAKMGLSPERPSGPGKGKDGKGGDGGKQGGGSPDAGKKGKGGGQPK